MGFFVCLCLYDNYYICLECSSPSKLSFHGTHDKYPHLLRLNSKTLLLWGLSWLYPSPTDHVYLASSTSRITYIKSSITNLSQMYPLTIFLCEEYLQLPSRQKQPVSRGGHNDTGSSHRYQGSEKAVGNSSEEGAWLFIPNSFAAQAGESIHRRAIRR